MAFNDSSAPNNTQAPAESNHLPTVEISEREIIGGPTTPMNPEAPALSDAEQIETIAQHFHAIMETLGLDLADDSLQGTPRRVAKMFVQEFFDGLKAKNAPKVALFDNKYNYGQMLVEKDIQLHSMCEHHFLPIVGKAHVAYIPQNKVVGLSKLNRIVDFFASRPQVQERLTQQIAHYMMDALETPDVAVLIDAEHMCVSLRGVEDPCSETVTSAYYGVFEDPHRRDEFLRYCRY
jgi:GTP cyclohydrolase I